MDNRFLISTICIKSFFIHFNIFGVFEQKRNLAVVIERIVSEVDASNHKDSLVKQKCFPVDIRFLCLFKDDSCSRKLILKPEPLFRIFVCKTHFHVYTILALPLKKLDHLGIR